MSHESCDSLEVFQVAPTCLTFVWCPFLEYEVQEKQPLQALSANWILSRVNLGASFSCRSSATPPPLCSAFSSPPLLHSLLARWQLHTSYPAFLESPRGVVLAVRALLVLLTVTSLYHLLKYIYDLLMQHVPLLSLTSFNSRRTLAIIWLLYSNESNHLCPSIYISSEPSWSGLS